MKSNLSMTPVNIYARAWRRKNPDKIRAINRRKYLENSEKYKKASAARYHALSSEEKRRYGSDNHLKKTYGINLEQFKELVSKQNGLCLICSRALRLGLNGWTSRFATVDHDHKTGKIRGVLCHRCNTGLAFVERPEWPEKAKYYLNNYK